MSNQRRGGFGHGPRAVEKANDFKGAMKKNNGLYWEI